MSGFPFNCIATGIGSMPQHDPTAAYDLIAKYLSDIPFWPQLSNLSEKEKMYLQFSEGFAGIKSENGRVSYYKPDRFDQQIEKLYMDFAGKKFEDYSISAEYASGLYAFLDIKGKSPELVKGQIIGPVSWGLSVIGNDERGILYDEQLADAISKFLHLKASWQENFLKTIAPNTIIFVDEPYLVALGSASVAISDQKVSGLLEEVLSGISGIKGIHCCGSTNWSIILKSSTDILSFDTYNYADSLSCYPAETRNFIKRGGAIAWGIVPNDEEFLKKETLPSLVDRLGEAIAPFTRDGISFKQILTQSIVTPSCGLASTSTEVAGSVLELLSGLSATLKRKYL